jgi:hypothetical protein
MIKPWWKKLFRVRREDRVLAPLSVDLETGQIYIWSGYRLIDTGINLATIGLPRK